MRGRTTERISRARAWPHDERTDRKRPVATGGTTFHDQSIPAQAGWHSRRCDIISWSCSTSLSVSGTKHWELLILTRIIVDVIIIHVDLIVLLLIVVWG